MSGEDLESLSFDLTEEQDMFQKEVRRFAEERILPEVSEWESKKSISGDILAEMADLGLLSMMLDEAHGGAEVETLTYLLAVEEVARVFPSLATMMSVTNSVCCWPIHRFGSSDLKARVLPDLATGGTLGGFGLTEPGAGSDAGSLRTTARRDGNDWILDGEKAWITNAGQGRYFVVIARIGGEEGSRGLTAFVVPRDAPGFSAGPQEDKLGQRASDTASRHFAECRIPDGNILGEEGQGFRIAMKTLDHSRLGVAALAVGIHRRALELALTYAQDRVQFGAPIARQQAIQFKIAQMATELSACQALTRYAALEEDSSKGGRLASQAKLMASEAANRACWESLQIHGGNGYCEEYEIARLYRDVRVTTIYEGTSEMQRLVIAKHLLR